MIEYQGNVLPVEVKAGTSGSLKSLHVFVANKKTAIAVRFNTNQGILEKESKASIGNQESHEFSLLSLSLYQVGQIERLYQKVKEDI